MKSGKQEYYGLQALRAVAALAVVAGHSTDYLMKENGRVPGILSWIHGPAGVDIFFAISGFVMMISAGRLKNLAHPAWAFFSRRVIRIVPLYWLLTALRLALLAWRPALAANGRGSNWNAFASFLFVPSVGATGEIRPVIPVGWTLSFEFAFYVVFALGLWLARGRLLTFLTLGMVAVAGVGFARSESWPAWTALADPIVLEFLGGVWLARQTLVGRLPGRWVCVGMTVLGVLGLVLRVPASGLDRPWTWGVPALLLVGGMVGLEDVVGPRVPGWLLLLGDASYSIYLVQTFVFPVEHLGFRLLAEGLVHREPVRVGLGLMALGLVSSAVAGVALYHWVELPMTRALRRRLGVAKPRAVPA